MLILVHDPSALLLDFCLRATYHGHSVMWYTKGSRSAHIGDGLIQKVTNWRKLVDYADLILVGDNLQDMDEIDDLIKKGYPVFGPGKRAASLELDRMHGQDIIEKFGGPTIPSHRFKNFDKAIQFVKDNPGRYVCKPCGEEEDKTLSYVSKDEADLIGFLTKRKEKGGKPDFILQEFRKGHEIAVTGIFGKNGWFPFWCEGFEHKKLMDNDLGPNTGEMGTVIRYTKESKLADMFLKPMEDHLKSIGFVGVLDMNVIIDEKNGTPWPMEWTARFGYPMINIMYALHESEDPAQWMLDAVHGDHTLEVKEQTSVGVVIANSDFPWNAKDEESYLDFPIFMDEISEDELDHVHPAEVKLSHTCKMMGKELMEDCPEWGTAGSYILICTGVADTISEAKDKAYELVKKIKVGNDIAYRTDIGKKMEEVLPKLHKLGYCRSWKY